MDTTSFLSIYQSSMTSPTTRVNEQIFCPSPRPLAPTSLYSGLSQIDHRRPLHLSTSDLRPSTFDFSLSSLYITLLPCLLFDVCHLRLSSPLSSSGQSPKWGRYRDRYHLMWGSKATSCVGVPFLTDLFSYFRSCNLCHIKHYNLTTPGARVRARSREVRMSKNHLQYAYSAELYSTGVPMPSALTTA